MTFGCKQGLAHIKKSHERHALRDTIQLPTRPVEVILRAKCRRWRRWHIIWGACCFVYMIAWAVFLRSLRMEGLVTSFVKPGTISWLSPWSLVQKGLVQVFHLMSLVFLKPCHIFIRLILHYIINGLDKDKPISGVVILSNVADKKFHNWFSGRCYRHRLHYTLKIDWLLKGSKDLRCPSKCLAPQLIFTPRPPISCTWAATPILWHLRQKNHYRTDRP